MVPPVSSVIVNANAESARVKVESRAQLAAIKPGEKVEFEMLPKPDKDGDYVIRRIRSVK